MHPPKSESVESPATASRAGGLPTVGGKYFALAVLFVMNLLNYVDRYSFFGVAVQIKEAFDIDSFWYSVLSVSFMIVYTIVAPFMGWLGDRYHRRALLAGGVALWSVATLGTAFSYDFWHIFFWRSLLGVGEASYGVIAPALIADLFSVRERGRAMGVYYLALPLGERAGLRDRLVDRPGLRLAGGVLRRRIARFARRRGGAPDERPGTGRVRGRPHLRQGRSARDGRGPPALPDPDLRPQHRRHGGGHVRHRRLCRPRRELLPGGPRHVA